MFGYKPKHGKAPWVGTILDKRPKISTKPNTTPARRPIKRTQMPIASVSKAKRSERAEYTKEARAAVAAAIKRGDRCPVFASYFTLTPEMQAMLKYPWNDKLRTERLNEIHHTHGRLGLLLIYKPWWQAVSKWGHRVIHAFPHEARKRGWICELGQWNSPPPISG